MDYHKLPTGLSPKELAIWMLIDIVSHFGEDPVNRRCVDINGCYYSPKSLTNPHPDNIGCGIGMFIEPNNASKLDNILNVGESGIDIVLEEYGDTVKELIPEEIKRIDVEILNEFQQLHDGANYWLYKGLSTKGEVKVASIRRLIEDTYPL